MKEIMNNEENIIPTVITNLPEFSTWVNSLSTIQNATPQAFFYRGHANADYELQPTAYRMVDGASYRYDESRLYHEMLRRDPTAFSPDSTLFERLARMQHYGLPTRLLDLTQNPLVALFFACTSNPENDNKNGSVLFFEFSSRDVYHQQTLPNLALAGIDKPLSLSLLGQQIYHALKKQINEDIEFSEKHPEYLQQDLVALLHRCIENIDQADKEGVFQDILSYSCYIDRLLSEIYNFCKELCEKLQPKNTHSADTIPILRLQSSTYKFRNNLYDWEKKIITEISDQIGLRNDVVKLPELLFRLTHFNIVFPPMNNERIRRQRGAFLVFPPAKSNLWTAEQFKTPIKATIPADAKKTLLRELANVGITESYLFPELDRQVSDICNRYPRQKESSAINQMKIEPISTEQAN